MTGPCSAVHKTVDCRIACVNYPRLDNFVTLAAEGTRIGYKKMKKAATYHACTNFISHDPQFPSLCSLIFFFYHTLIISTNLALFILYTFGFTIHKTEAGDVEYVRKLGAKKKITSSVYDCTVEDVEYICNSNSTLCLFYFAIFVVLLLS